MHRHGRCSCFGEFSGGGRNDGFSHGPCGAGQYTNTGRTQRLVRVGAHIAGDDHLDRLARHHLGRLNAGPAASTGARVRYGFEVHSVGIHNDKIGAAPKAGIHLGLQIIAACGNRDLHNFPPTIINYAIAEMNSNKATC
jgi:hypothetical protein